MVELSALSCLACQVRHAQSTYTRHHDDETVRLAAESLLEKITQVRSRREIRNALLACRVCRQPLAGLLTASLSLSAPVVTVHTCNT